MIWEAYMALALVLMAWAATGFIAWHMGGTSMRTRLKLEQSERRSAVRAERRAEAAMRGHQIAPFPGEDWSERLADTGELRIAAEIGDLDELARQNAAFFRVLNLATSWTKRRAVA